MSLRKLKDFTNARIGLEKSGISIKTKELLKLKSALAKAHDAVLGEWNWCCLQNNLKDLKTLILHSQVRSKSLYLERPDLGKVLDPLSEQELLSLAKGYDIACIVSDGLSATAISHHFLPLWKLFDERLQKSKFSRAPLCLVPFGRVAISDEIAFRLNAKLAIMFIGERPGLSAPDSLGIYLSYNPHPLKKDSERNCISNIHIPHGLSYEQACDKLWYLIRESMKHKISGVGLKEGLESLPKSAGMINE